MSLGLYGKGMHQFILDEMELGTRVAAYLDEEEVDPLGWLFDIHYREYCRACDYDMHRCPGCGIPLKHDEKCCDECKSLP
jgi:hypothetical protein